MEQNWLPQVKFLGSYTVPKIDVQIGASFQSIPGIEYSATYAAPNTDLARPVAHGGLGRLPTNGVRDRDDTGQPDPAGLALRRAVQPDRRPLRQDPPLRPHSSRLSLDLFNVFNSDVLSGASATYATWLAPTAVVAPRLTKVSLTFDF